MKSVKKICSGKVVASKDGYEAIDCLRCGYIHITPLPSEIDLENYYSDIFYSDYKPDYMEQHQKDLKWWNQVFEERRNIFEKYLDSKSSRRILDIGSGPGFFLKYFKDNGWEVLGIEPGKAAVMFSQKLGLEVVQDSVYNLDKLEINKFDVIHSNQTFEHLLQPKTALSKIKEILNPGGIIHLTVANDFNPIQKIATEQLGLENWWFVPPEHINYFNADSIKTLIKNCGFKILDVKSTFPIDIFLLMGDNYIEKPIVGKQAHLRRKNLEFSFEATKNLDFKTNLYRSFSNLGIGREIEILATCESS